MGIDEKEKTIYFDNGLKSARDIMPKPLLRLVKSGIFLKNKSPIAASLEVLTIKDDLPPSNKFVDLGIKIKEYDIKKISEFRGDYGDPSFITYHIRPSESFEIETSFIKSEENVVFSAPLASFEKGGINYVLLDDLTLYTIYNKKELCPNINSNNWDVMSNQTANGIDFF